MASDAIHLLMRLFSYIVARDYGFAPNPFHGLCTLATCKPRIRASANIGDWIVGTGAKTKYDLAGRLLYAMKVDEVLTFDTYWADPRFLSKRPVLNGSLKQVYGDNIYRRGHGRWCQVNSHHSLGGGRRNLPNIARDTSVDRLLLGRRFVYFGKAAPLFPKRFRPFKATGEDICCPGQGHRVMSSRICVLLEKWLEKQGRWGLQGMPLEFDSHERNTPEASRRNRGSTRVERLALAQTTPQDEG